MGPTSVGSTHVSAVSYSPATQSGYDPQPGYLPGTSPSSTQSQTFGASNHSTPVVTSAYGAEGGPSTFASSGSGLAASGYSYVGSQGSDLHLLTYDNETDIGQHLASFEHTEMMSWFGDYFPSDVFGLYPGGETNMS
jgi:hypothetical protein